MCILDIFICVYIYLYGLPWWLSGKELTCKAGATGDAGSIPGILQARTLEWAAISFSKA